MIIENRLLYAVIYYFLVKEKFMTACKSDVTDFGSSNLPLPTSRNTVFDRVFCCFGHFLGGFMVEIAVQIKCKWNANRTVFLQKCK